MRNAWWSTIKSLLIGSGKSCSSSSDDHGLPVRPDQKTSTPRATERLSALMQRVLEVMPEGKRVSQRELEAQLPQRKASLGATLAAMRRRGLITQMWNGDWCRFRE